MSKELCNKTQKECGYLNFTNDVLDLMKKHNIKDVLTLETTLKEHELMKDIRITARFDLAQVNKEHKALEFLKEKCEFDFLEIRINGELAKYEIHIRPKNKEQLLFNCLALYPKTPEEYELLKEVLL